MTEGNNESNAIKEKLDKAFKKLWTLDLLDRKSLRSSHYNFGVEKPFVNDRCTFNIKLGTSTIKCQVIFDSNNYNFPPDVLFHHLPNDVTESINDKSTLLPDKNWDLDNEDCLHDWFQRILKLIVKESPVIEDEKVKEKPIKKWSIFDDDDDDDDVFEDTKKYEKQKKTSTSVLDANYKVDPKKEDNEQKQKQRRLTLKGNDDFNILEEIEKENRKKKTHLFKDEVEEKDIKEEKKPKRNYSLFDDRNDNIDIFEEFKNEDEEKKKEPVVNDVKEKKETKNIFPDIEFMDDDYYNYNSSCDVVDTTKDFNEDVDMEDVVDTTKNRDHVPDVEIISSSPSKSKEKIEPQSPKEEKPIGRIGANLAGLKKKMPPSMDADESVFDFPTSSSPSSLYNKTSSPKRQSFLPSTFKSHQRPDSTTKKGYTIEKRPKDVVDLIIDDNDDFDETPPPPKMRKTERQTKLFDLGPSKSPKRAEQRQSRLINGEQRQSKLTNTGSRMKSQDEYRKKFMATWLHRFRNYIIEYDTEKFEHFSFYFTFGLSNSSEEWTQFRDQTDLSKMGNYCKPKLHAPVLVHFKMDRFFPSSDLSIKVISVLNTTDIGSDVPEEMNLQYTVNEDDTITNSIESIMELLKSKVPRFHYQLKETFF